MLSRVVGDGIEGERSRATYFSEVFVYSTIGARADCSKMLTHALSHSTRGLSNVLAAATPAFDDVNHIRGGAVEAGGYIGNIRGEVESV